MTNKAQMNQDIILDQSFFKGKTEGFFVEVGALDGVGGSNTYFFEKERNWKGILIEPNPVEFDKLKNCDRPNSIKYNCAVFHEEKEVNFLSIEGPCNVLSGIVEFYNPAHLQRIERELYSFKDYPVGHELYSRKEIVKIDTKRLQTIFDENHVSHIDLLSVDVEGAELQVLESIDFDKVNIDCILLENNYGIEKETSYLLGKGYEILGNIEWDVVFTKNKI